LSLFRIGDAGTICESASPPGRKKTDAQKRGANCIFPILKCTR